MGKCEAHPWAALSTEALEDGLRTLVVCHTWGEARQILAYLALHAPRGSKRAWTEGRECITYPNGGAVWLMSINSKAERGKSVDVLYFTAPGLMNNELRMASLMPALNGSTVAEVKTLPTT